MRRIGIVAGLALVATVLTVLAAQAGQDDWPKWLGPKGDGISTEAGLLDAWPEDGPAKLWSVRVGVGYSSPVAADGKIYMFSMESGKDTLLCVDEAGKEVWKKSYDNGWTDRGRYPGTRATPVIEGEFIYTYGGKGDLTCRKLADGAEVWRTNVLEQAGAKSQKWGEASSPAILGELIYVQGGNDGNFAVAVNKADGKVAWKSEKAMASYAAVLPVEVGGKKVAVVFAGKSLYGLDATNGKTLWSQKWETSWDVNAATPIYRDGRLFVTSGYNHGCMMLKLSAGGAAKEWERKEPHSKQVAPILDGDHLYVNSEGELMCMGWPKGEILWRSKEPRLGIGGSFVRNGDKLVALTEGGALELIEATPKGCKVISKKALFGGGENWSTPMLYRGKLFVKGPAELVCFDVKKKS